jgi:hypothetical protein
VQSPLQPLIWTRPESQAELDSQKQQARSFTPPQGAAAAVDGIIDKSANATKAVTAMDTTVGTGI